MTENQTEYESLKKKIVKKCGDSVNLEKIKEYFSCAIKSRRTINKIKSLDDVFSVLEDLDVLDSNHVQALTCLGNLLGNEDIVNFVNGYKKLFAEENAICSCGANGAFPFPIINPQRELNENERESLDTAINNVALNIRDKWRVLATELDIPEWYIDKIREKYPRDMYLQALKALQIWKKDNADTATIDTLKCALEKRLCKMKGIGLHMLRPIHAVD